MNNLAIHTSHDGAITVVKDDQFLLHAQIVRFNHILSSAIPSKKLLIQIKSLKIKFDRLLITFLSDSGHWLWEKMLRDYDIIDANTKIEYFGRDRHHLFHTFCARATTGPNKQYLVIDGHGSPLGKSGSVTPTGEKKIYEQESLFVDDKPVWQTQHGIGVAYEEVTAALLKQKYLAFRNCGKTMALSAYGNIDADLYPCLYEGLKTKGKIVVPNDLEIENKSTQDFLHTFQHAVENLIESLMPERDVTLTGGVAQNVLANSKFFKRPNFKVDPLCTDTGISLGCINAYMGGELQLPHPVYLGFEPDYYFLHYPTFKDCDITDTSVDEVCQILKEEPVALFQGRSEQGQRGLGNRSLLMDATHPQAIEKVNKIKRREWYRPFAPAIVHAFAKQYFEIQGSSPHMLHVFKAKESMEAVTSIDSTARIQTVTPNANPEFFKLLNTFREKYGTPYLLNTSLNLSGHTLVEDLNDLKYMLDNSPLRYAYLPTIGKLIFKE